MGQAFPEGTRETLLFLATAGIAVPLFHRLRVSPVLGFLIAGVALGPFGLGHIANRFPALSVLAITDTGRLDDIADLGVVFLLFMVGLELSFERLSRLRRLVFGFGALQVGLSAAAIAGRLWRWACRRRPRSCSGSPWPCRRQPSPYRSWPSASTSIPRRAARLFRSCCSRTLPWRRCSSRSRSSRRRATRGSASSSS